jgi:hypothetical protein
VAHSPADDPATLSVGCCLPSAPWPRGVVEVGARAITSTPGTVRGGVEFAYCTVKLVHATGVPSADGTRRHVLYRRGGAFLTCGPYSYGRLVCAVEFRRQLILVPTKYREDRNDRRLLRQLPVVAPERP